MNIQYIAPEQKRCDLQSITCKTFSDVVAFDCFDINIIDLNYSCLWVNSGITYESINRMHDFVMLSELIRKRQKSKVVIIYPVNYNFRYNRKSSSNEYWHSIELKNMLSQLNTCILSRISTSFNTMKLIFECSTTILENCEFESEFSFELFSGEPITRADKCNSVTTIHVGNDVYITTLHPDSFEDLMKYILQVFSEVDNVYPEWIKNFEFYNDAELNKKVLDNEKLIEKAVFENNSYNAQLKKNIEYKTVLFTSGNHLVKVVFDILQQLLGCDLSNFKDEKREDFRFSINGKTIIGEIKGVGKNVSKSHVSQVMTHALEYAEDSNIPIEEISKILIITPQREKPVEEREPVSPDVIHDADLKGVLIIKTDMLLKLFSDFLNNKISRENIEQIFLEGTGLYENV